MKKHVLIPLAVVFLSVIGCSKPENGGGKDNPQPPAPPQEQIIIPSTVDVTPVVPPEGGDAKITFTAATAWTASVISTKADSWVDVNPKSGNPGPAEIKITTTPNDTYVERNATIQIKCGTETKDIVLTQKQVDNITVTTDKVELGAEGGTFTIELKSNIDFSYEIKGDWIKYVSTKAYSDKTLTFTAEPNDGVQKREGSVTVKGGEFSETIKVYQNGEEPTLIITQNEYNLEAEGDNIAVEVSSNVAVTMTIPENVSWITENKTKSVSTSTFHLDVAANETYETRSAEITFSNEETGLSEKITVSQKGKTFIHVTGVTLDKSELTLIEGEKSTLVATVAPEDATNKTVTWSTSDATIATVSNGVVTAKKVGKATITAKAGDKSATCSVTVKEPDNPPTPGNSLVGTSWTCSISDVGNYVTTYVDATLYFDTQSTFIMKVEETYVVKEHYIDWNGDGIYDDYEAGGTYHDSYTYYGAYTLNGSSIVLFAEGERVPGTISGNIITLYGDEDDEKAIFQKL